jgi:hypothetical protein
MMGMTDRPAKISFAEMRDRLSDIEERFTRSACGRRRRAA